MVCRLKLWLLGVQGEVSHSFYRIEILQNAVEVASVAKIAQSDGQR